MEKLYSLKEAKHLLGVKTRTIQQWDRTRKLKIIRILGGRRRVPESEILRMQAEAPKRIKIHKCYFTIEFMSKPKIYCILEWEE
jgi:excisionase family DNA binding protein